MESKQRGYFVCGLSIAAVHSVMYKRPRSGIVRVETREWRHLVWWDHTGLDPDRNGFLLISVSQRNPSQSTRWSYVDWSQSWVYYGLLHGRSWPLIYWWGWSSIPDQYALYFGDMINCGAGNVLYRYGIHSFLREVEEYLPWGLIRYLDGKSAHHP